MVEILDLYEQLHFKPILLKGYSATYNSSKDYKAAKTPVQKGFMDPDYIPPSHIDVQAWLAAGGWVGHIVPQGFFVVDTEDTYVITAISSLCRDMGIVPATNVTNRGLQYIFKTDAPLLGESEQFVKLGVPVTYRAANKNYVILPPTNGRTWDNYESLFDPPELPDTLFPYDQDDPYQIACCLSFCVGEALQSGSLSGCEDIDMAYMAYLIENDFLESQIRTFFQMVFRSEFDNYRTASMYQRAKEKINKREVIRGAGSFVQKVQDAGLKKVQKFIGELQRLKHPETGVSQGKKKAKPEPWSDPIPFDDISLLPDFPVDVLPDIGRRMVPYIAEITQVDSGLPGLIYLAVLSTCRAGDQVNLISHREPCNLYLAATLPSGHRKTSIATEMSRPIYDYQYQKQVEQADRIREATNKFKVLEARLHRLQKQAANTDDIAQRLALIREADAVSLEMQLNPIPLSPVFICDDVTTERLGMLMAENGERMAILSAEGGIFKLISGLYNDREGNFDLYLKAHAGDPWSNHRVGRESQSMRRPALTMGLAIQPDVLDEIGNNRHFRDRGLIARFLFSICKSRVGYRTRQTKSLAPALIEEYRNHIYSLLDIPAGCEFTLTPEAQAVWDEFYNDVEQDMRPNGSLEYLQDWGSKLPGAAGRIAGLLHMATHGAPGVGKPISVTIVTASCVIAGYFREHALAAFRQMNEDHRLLAAKKILSYLQRIKPERFKGRDVLRHAYFADRTMEEILPGIKILLERGYIREAEGEYAGKGRPEAIIYEVNPRLFENQHLAEPVTKVTKVAGMGGIE